MFSGDFKVVAFVPLDLRRPVRIKVGEDPVKKEYCFPIYPCPPTHHCCVCSVIKLSGVSRYPSPVDVSGRTLPSFLWIPAYFDPDGLAMTSWGQAGQ